jgi:hypothetical protein
MVQTVGALRFVQRKFMCIRNRANDVCGDAVFLGEFGPALYGIFNFG